MSTWGLTVIALLTLLLLSLGWLEARAHQRVVQRMRVRLHVNGTRGKSSVTRLLVAGLRAGGLRVAGKTTGTLPRILHPDGSEEPVLRNGKSNIIEQVAVMRRLSELGAEVVVVECMALQPFLQWVSTARLIQPTHGVITNVRADHLDVMGPTVRDVALALAGSAPLRGVLYVGDTRYKSVFERATQERDSQLVIVRPETAEQPVILEELAQFSYIEHAENVDLALRICSDLGVPRAVALRGMQEVTPDPGALLTWRAQVQGQRITLINGFAANDPESTGQVWELASAWAGPRAKRIALFNCRADRADRSHQLGEAVVKWPLADHYVIVGTGTQFFLHAAEAAGLDRARLVTSEGESAAVLVERLAHLAGDQGVVVGLGNIGGVGLDLIEEFKQRATDSDDFQRDLERFSRGPRRELALRSRAAPLPSQAPSTSHAAPLRDEAPTYDPEGPLS